MLELPFVFREIVASLGVAQESHATRALSSFIRDCHTVWVALENATQHETRALENAKLHDGGTGDFNESCVDITGDCHTA